MKDDLTENVGRRFGGFLARLGSVALTGVLAMAGVPAGAHPGHGLGDASAGHVVTSPYHLSVLGGSLLVTGLVLGLGARLVQNARARRCLQFGAGCAWLAAAALWLR